MNALATRDDLVDGNNFVVEPSGNFGGDAWRKTGYLRLKSAVTGTNYVRFSETDLTTGGKKKVCQRGMLRLLRFCICFD